MTICADKLTEAAKAKRYVECTQGTVETRHNYLTGIILVRETGCGSVYDIKTGKIVTNYNPEDVQKLSGLLGCVAHEQESEEHYKSRMKKR